MKFIPHDPEPQNIKAPYFEDVRADDAPGYRTTRPINLLKDECMTEFTKLGAEDVQFISGKFDATPERHGYIITFRIYGAYARISIAGFPMRKETTSKTEQVLKQALFVFRDWLKGEVQMRIYHPDYLPLTQYLTGGEGQPTVMESLRTSGNLPRLKG